MPAAIIQKCEGGEDDAKDAIFAALLPQIALG